MTWYWFAIGSAVLLAVATLLEKKILFKEHAMEFSAVLAFFNALISLPLLLLADFSNISLQVLGAIYIASLLGTASFYLVAKVNRHMEVSESSPLLVLAPAVGALFGFIFLNERMSYIQVSGIVLMIFGAYVLETYHLNNPIEPLKSLSQSKYIRIIGGALLLYATGVLFDRIILSEVQIKPLTYIVIIHFFIAVNFFILLSVFHDGWGGIKHGTKIAGWPILLMSVITILHRLAYANAISIAYIGLASSIKRSSALFTTIVGGELFNEKNLKRKIIAVVIMLGGVFLLAF